MRQCDFCNSNRTVIINLELFKCELDPYTGEKPD